MKIKYSIFIILVLLFLLVHACYPKSWNPEYGAAVVQVYKNGELIFDQSHLPGIYLSLTSGNIYELKLWVSESQTPLASWIKIRRDDPIPDVVPIPVDWAGISGPCLKTALIRETRRREMGQIEKFKHPAIRDWTN
jgi:hypothetical protein